jgi:hypothetical protein
VGIIVCFCPHVKQDPMKGPRKKKRPSQPEQGGDKPKGDPMKGLKQIASTEEIKRFNKQKAKVALRFEKLFYLLQLKAKNQMFRLLQVNAAKRSDILKSQTVILYSTAQN